MFPAWDVNEWVSACICDVDCVWERGRKEGWTPGPKCQRRSEGQHQTPQQLINACRSDPNPAWNNTNTSKTPSKAPILTIITLSHRKAVKSTHPPHRFKLLSCLSCLAESQRWTKATDWAWKSWCGADKIRLHTIPVCNECTFWKNESEPTHKERGGMPFHTLVSELILVSDNGQISILFSNFACCTRWLATNEKCYAPDCLTRWICLPEGYPACSSETKRPLFDFYTAWPFLIGRDWLAWKSILRCAFDAALSFLHTVCR